MTERNKQNLTTANHDSPSVGNLPTQLQKQIMESENIRRSIDCYELSHPRLGRPPKDKPIDKLCTLSADSVDELSVLIDLLQEIVGQRTRGNKRIGKKALYADLLQEFLTLKQRGITLPRNKNLSKAACSGDLGEILRRHGYTDADDRRLMKSSTLRQEIANNLDRVFSRVTEVITKTPPAKIAK